MAGAIATAMLFAFPAFAQDSRLSLADRVTRLEQQAQSRDSGGVGMVNQMSQMQAQLRQLQGQIEELQHHLQQLDDKSKAQYIDLDSRLSRIEQGGAGNAGAAAGAGAAASGANTAAANATAPASAGSAAPLSAADNDAAQAAYGVAFKSIRDGNYVAAAREFHAFVEQYPNHPLAPNAWYWLGESYYVTTNYPVALEAFKQVVSQFPDSEKAPDALLKVGFTELELKHEADGKAVLTSVIGKYPGSNAAQLAQERLRRLQRANGG
ncbi:MAG: tol-pal system protein YbgF [Xanthomonadales bacterium]|nr:tol-pal system protein YbgF [Xanthomonadales bacterium]